MIHFFQNDPEVPPGNLSEYLDERGVIHVTHHLYLGEPFPELRDITAAIVLGGSMGANDDVQHPFLKQLKECIRLLVREGIPYLGICLGGQLLAAATGGAVVSHRWEELGTLPVALTEAGNNDPLLTGVNEQFTTFQWHHDSFDPPPGASVLASSPACPHQLFRVGTVAWGTQFHPEVTEQIIRDWCAWDPVTAVQADAMVTHWRAVEAEYLRISRQMMDNFLKLSGTV